MDDSQPSLTGSRRTSDTQLRLNHCCLTIRRRTFCENKPVALWLTWSRPSDGSDSTADGVHLHPRWVVKALERSETTCAADAGMKAAWTADRPDPKPEASPRADNDPSVSSR
jgi:hypothetical protein